MFIQTNNDKNNKKLKFLIIEENKLHQKTIKLLLTSLVNFAYEIYEVHGGNEAIKVIKNHVFDLIFMNLDLPDINAVEVALTIRKEGRKNYNTPVVVISWYYANKNKFDNLGIDFLSNPINSTEFQAILEKYNLSTKRG